MKTTKIFFAILALMATEGNAFANAQQKFLQHEQEALDQGVLESQVEIQQEQNFTKQFMAAQHMLDTEDVTWAHKAYQEALVTFYKSLPAKSEYAIIIEGLALDLKRSYNSWLKVTNEKLEYMDSYTFEKFYWNRKSQVESRKGGHKKHRKQGWTQLQKLRNVGQTLDIAVQNAAENLQQTELMRAKEYYPDCAANFKKSDELQKSWDKYSQLVQEYDVPIERYTKSVNSVKNAKLELEIFMNSTPGLREFKNDEDFDTHYLRGISANEGLPKASTVQLEHQQFPDNKLISKAYNYIKNINESDRLIFNTKFKHALDMAQAWAEAAREMDEALLHLSAQIKAKGDQDEDVLKANNYVVEAIQQRKQLNQVWSALQVLNQRAQASQYHSSIYHQQISEQEEFAFTFKLILNTVLIASGCIFCNVFKKQFFSDEETFEDIEEEGGEPEQPKPQSSKKIFKKQMKRIIKNSRQNEEYLMPEYYNNQTDDYA